MIEDEKLGLKIAENPEEKFWTEMKERTEKAIETCKHELVVQNHVLVLCLDKLK